MRKEGKLTGKAGKLYGAHDLLSDYQNQETN
jgi:hypothetical protein